MHEKLGTSLIFLGLLIPEVDLLHETTQQVQLCVISIEADELRGMAEVSGTGSEKVTSTGAEGRPSSLRGGAVVTVAISFVLCL